MRDLLGMLCEGHPWDVVRDLLGMLCEEHPWDVM